MSGVTRTRRLITSALPYVNNIPHLGNLIQVLSADVFARYCRMSGYETLYVCGSDEYGTATETRAREEGISPRALCDRYHRIHSDIYRWFTIAFDRYGRTATPQHTQITQHIFQRLYDNGYIREHRIEQLYSEQSQMFLPDRYVRGTCPNCGYGHARGDQCESCGKLLDPVDLIDPICVIDNSRPVFRSTQHLYLDLPAILPNLQEWLKEAPRRGRWAHNAIKITEAWIRDGLKERAITRDLEWGIPVPLDGFRDKVFYVWFDACIGYISITANHTDDWETWWRNPDGVELFQFIGKDNIPFHTVIFPSSQIGSGERWTMLHHMSSSEYLNYEGSQFSKSRGIGVFGDGVRETGIPADVWRFYIFYNRPETSDFNFTWADFQRTVNGELIGNFGNLVYRTLSFVANYFDGVIPEARRDDRFWQPIMEHEKRIEQHLERAELRSAFRLLFEISNYGNRRFQQAEPWKRRVDEPEAIASLIFNLIYLVRDLAILVAPFLPTCAEQIAAMAGGAHLSWEMLGVTEGISRIERPRLLFRQLDDTMIVKLKLRFSGRKRQDNEMNEQTERETVSIEDRFVGAIELVAAKIVGVEVHPNADKLYIETLDDGSGVERRIVSGLAPYYRPEELEGHTIVLVRNLKPAKFRGVKSEGMLLAAEQGDTVEVLFVDHASPGAPIELDPHRGDRPEQYAKIDIKTFFSIPLEVRNSRVYAGTTTLVCSGRPLGTRRVNDGKVG